MTSKYRVYPKYKESGVESLGMLPSHWVVQSLSIATKRISVGLATSVTDYYRDDGIPIIRNMNIKEGYFDGSDILYLDEKFAAANSGKVVYEGDVIAVHTGSNLGLACIVPKKFDNCHTFTTLIVTVGKNLLNRYLTYCINSAHGKAEVNRLKFGFGKDNLNVKEFRSFYTVLPELMEQQQIANFLDYETAKIDTLIEKQQQLITLLKEKRQAVISHAVTKGLNPNAPMRDSGVEWLGEVPAHWELSKVKFEYENLDGRRVPLSSEERSYKQGEYPYYGASGVIDFVDDYLFDENLVLVSEDGANLLMRTYAIAFPAYGKYWVNNHAHILKPKNGNTEFWSEVIEVRDLTPYISGSAQPKFTSEALSNLVIAIPRTIEETNQIASFISTQKEKYLKLIEKAERSIQLMQERRTALISAAVTGKIDVRDWVAPNDASKAEMLS